ncbi:MAG TPA: type 2 lanthipeptide synthetase LanM family protein [Virgibacillus sp.]|nr:type 2 lanthipeptide synthetase LanM family protein [Virgibacillus sp.]HLR68401.1 type 2 lanthipeptide synthetase LanM family protein [Virgibacillus sp.]
METIKKNPWDKFNLAAYLEEITISHVEGRDKDEALQKWMKKTGFSKLTLKDRLKQANMTIEEFINILNAKERNDIPTADLEWIKLFEKIFSNDVNISTSGKTIFECLVEPFIHFSSKQIDIYFQNNTISSSRVCIDAVKQSIISNIKNQLSPKTVKPLILEINISRLKGELTGENDEDQFAYFIQSKLSTYEGVLKFLSEYPVLARLLTETTQSSLNHQLKLVNRFNNDFDEIHKIVTPFTSPLINIETGAGDTHNNGQMVSMLTFENGMKLVYKPRPLSTDLSFQNLINWCNDQLRDITFAKLNILDKGSYGWQEFIEYKECRSKEEVKRFYTRLGGYLSILYLLNAVDFHFENIIAHGEHPYLIDLESICYPLQPMEEQNTAQHQAIKTLMKSTLGTGLLPIQYKPDGSMNVEVSGVGGSKGQYIGKSEYIKDNKTPNISIEKTNAYMKNKKNRPVINNEIINPAFYLKYILEGFEKLYKLFLNHKDDLVHDHGLLGRFSNNRIRYIAKNTHVYAKFLKASEHTDYLQHGLERQRLFDLFWNYSNLSSKHFLITHSEVQDLLRGDVPYFYTKINSKSIWNSKGEEITNFLDVSGWDLIKEKIQSLHSLDLMQQKKWITTSVSTLTDENIIHRDQELLKKIKGINNPVQLSDAIGDHVAGEAVWGSTENDVTWIGVGMNQDEEVSLSPLSMGLYDGLTGISLFYAYLSMVTERKDFKNLSEGAIKLITNYLTYPENKLGISGFHGYASILYGLSVINEIHGVPDMEKITESLVKKISPLVSKDKSYDVIGGVAGTLMVLIKYWRKSKKPHILELAKKCGDHLITNSTAMNKGRAWMTTHLNIPLGGFSHGVAGIAVALYRLYKATGKPEYLSTCLQAIKYQDSLFNTNTSLWKNLTDSGGVHKDYGWCHGSSGIISAYLEMWELLDKKQKSNVKKAINKTFSNMEYNNHSLCHGALGNYWLLSATPLIDQKYEKNLSEFKKDILNDIEYDSITSGFPGAIPTPSLMLGSAGVGLGLLSMKYKIPNVLVLQ